MIIQYKQANIYRCSEMRLVPGINEVPDRVWNQVKDHPLVKLRIESGKIVVKNVEAKQPEVAPKSDENKAADTQAQVTPDSILKGMNANEAKELIKETLDLTKLQEWKGQEDRKGVQEALEKQIEFLSEDEDEKEGAEEVEVEI